MTANLLSFDVEDWFHSHNLWGGLDRAKWDTYELRVVENTRRILDLLDDHGHQATFFVLGHVAERAPELVEEISRRGHEVASHGYGHELLYELSEAELRNDLRRSLEVIEPHTDQDIVGYRAPSFSIHPGAVEALSDLEFEYDSSNFPAKRHDRYGSVEVCGDETVTRTSHGLQEIQLPLLEFGRLQIPWAGGGYFRFIPYPVFKRGISHIGSERDFVFYLHPWEIDPEQPVVDGVRRSYRVRHYTNLEKTEQRLNRLLSDFSWRSIGEHLQTHN